MNKILVVGAGITGSTIARFLVENSTCTVDVIDKRDHVAGNAYDYTNEYGVRIHKYGPHIFHSNNEKAVKWLQRFGERGRRTVHEPGQSWDGTFDKPPGPNAWMRMPSVSIELIHAPLATQSS